MNTRPPINTPRLLSMIVISLVAGALCANAEQIVPGSDARIGVEGTKYVQHHETGLRFKRFTDKTLAILLTAASLQKNVWVWASGTGQPYVIGFISVKNISD